MVREPTRWSSESMQGNKLYQKRAQRALPILVRQARLHNEITYSDLARELAMPNPRNLNYVLGSIGRTLEELSIKWNEEVPEIQSLVINQSSKMPGSGYFGGEDEFRGMTKRQREAVLNRQYAAIFAYGKWTNVLEALELDSDEPAPTREIEKARRFRGGESEAHRRFKDLIAHNPELVGLPSSCRCVSQEYQLPSGDVVDVFFEHRSAQYGVEVKSRISDEGDIARGLFQCVKYEAVLEAWRGFEKQDFDIQIILAMESAFPESLVPLKNALQITVIDSIETS